MNYGQQHKIVYNSLLRCPILTINIVGVLKYGEERLRELGILFGANMAEK